MKDKGSLTRRTLAAALAWPLSARAETARQERREEAGRPAPVRSAASRLRRVRPDKNVSPAFRFIP